MHCLVYDVHFSSFTFQSFSFFKFIPSLFFVVDTNISWDAYACMFGTIPHHGMPIYLFAYIIDIARCGTVPLGAASRHRAVLGAILFPSNGFLGRKWCWRLWKRWWRLSQAQQGHSCLAARLGRPCHVVRRSAPQSCSVVPRAGSKGGTRRRTR